MLFWKFLESLGVGVLLEEVGYWGRHWSVRSCPHFLSVLCFLTVDTCEQLTVSCSCCMTSISERIAPVQTVSQHKPLLPQVVLFRNLVQKWDTGLIPSHPSSLINFSLKWHSWSSFRIHNILPSRPHKLQWSFQPRSPIEPCSDIHHHIGCHIVWVLIVGGKTCFAKLWRLITVRTSFANFYNLGAQHTVGMQN